MDKVLRWPLIHGAHGGGGGGGGGGDDYSDNNHECVTPPIRAPINNGHVPAMLSRQKFKAVLGENINGIWF